MSVQFGRWNLGGQTPPREYIEKVGATLAPYGPDSNEVYANGGVTILYRAFHTTKESHHEVQPHVCDSGAVITWDGRLDNRMELMRELRGLLKTNSPMSQLVAANVRRMNDDFTDVEIVAGAYERWGTECLGRLIGDWALSIWNSREGWVLLAKDPIGTKHLYYSIGEDLRSGDSGYTNVTWSTILDPLVLYAGHTFRICEEYIAGWFSHFPAAHLTPYIGIHAVPPSSSVMLLRSDRHGVKNIVRKYWDFDPDKRIVYRTDAEYEERFRGVFAQAVQRRLRSDRPILAELSGGMDSSSIVCMADLVIARGEAECPRLDTISWYDDTYDQIEPDTNELHWITEVEEKRGRTGYHIPLGSLSEVASQRTFVSDFENDRFSSAPVPNRGRSHFSKLYTEFVRSRGYRITLSGLAGESATGGGVPTPTPELQDLLTRGQFVALARALKAWAAKMRTNRLPLLWEVARGFFPPAFRDVPEYVSPAAPWFHADFVRRNHAALRGYLSKLKVFGPLPSFQDNLSKLAAERRLLAFYALPSGLHRESRYPYVDRTLLEFLYAIPCDQIVRLGQRRSLMKRALVGIVPDELLTRRRKAFVPKEAKKDSAIELTSVIEMRQPMISSAIEIVDPNLLLAAVKSTQGKEEIPFHILMRTLTFESWLVHLTIQGVLTKPMSAEGQRYSSPFATAQKFS
jgi:asparagine synthase (glutamine-hydrolysing)